MIVVDTSAWVEYLRATGSPVHLSVRQLVREQAEIAVTDVVVMEVLAGARSERHADELRDTLLQFPVLRLGGLDGGEEAARLYRTCRRAGTTVRTLTDCLVAVAAIGADAPVLHSDRDFVAIAGQSELQIHRQ